MLYIYLIDFLRDAKDQKEAKLMSDSININKLQFTLKFAYKHPFHKNIAKSNQSKYYNFPLRYKVVLYLSNN